MRKSSAFRSLLAGAAVVLSAWGAAAQQAFDQPYYGGGYAPAPSYSYGGYGADWREGPGVRVAPVRYDQGYYYGGYQYPAGGYGGGDYRRAAYTNADVYVGPTPAYARPVYKRYARNYYAPGGGEYYTSSRYDAPRRHCCRALY
jgi:hypothetical protein